MSCEVVGAGQTVEDWPKALELLRTAEREGLQLDVPWLQATVEALRFRTSQRLGRLALCA